MKSNHPLISVIIPVYNAAADLAEALQSIQRQKYAPLEIIVVDDGSTDGSAGIAQGFRGEVHYLYQENRGPAAARNLGLEVSQGELVAFLDADDLWVDNKIEVQLAYLIGNPSLEAVIGCLQVQVLTESGDGQRRFADFAEPTFAPNLGTGLYRKSIFKKVGPFDPALRIGEDADFFLRMRENGVSMAMVEVVTLYYRLHGKNLTGSKRPRDAAFLMALKRSLDRRRQGEGQARPLSALRHPDADNRGSPSGFGPEKDAKK